MIPRPHYAQPGCVYFICLLRDDLLLRQGKEKGSNSSRIPSPHPPPFRVRACVCVCARARACVCALCMLRIACLGLWKDLLFTSAREGYCRL